MNTLLPRSARLDFHRKRLCVSTSLLLRVAFNCSIAWVDQTQHQKVEKDRKRLTPSSYLSQSGPRRARKSLRASTCFGSLYGCFERTEAAEEPVVEGGVDCIECCLVMRGWVSCVCWKSVNEWLSDWVNEWREEREKEEEEGRKVGNNKKRRKTANKRRVVWGGRGHKHHFYRLIDSLVDWPADWHHPLVVISCSLPHSYTTYLSSFSFALQDNPLSFIGMACNVIRLPFSPGLPELINSHQLAISTLALTHGFDGQMSLRVRLRGGPEVSPFGRKKKRDDTTLLDLC